MNDLSSKNEKFVKGLTSAVSILVGGILAACLMLCYVWLSAPAKLASLAERHGGGVDDNIPFRKIDISSIMKTEDRDLLMEYLPRVGHLSEVNIAENSPSAKWWTSSIDLSEMRTISIGGASEGSAPSDVLALVRFAPLMTRVMLYDSVLNREEVATLRHDCWARGVELLTYP